MISELMKSKIYFRFDQPRHFPGITWKEIDNYFKFSKRTKMECEYCGCELKAQDKFPYSKVVSIDHIIPLSRGGKNKFTNIAICCTRCNIVKGTMSGKTFIRFMDLIKQDEEILAEMFWGKKANLNSKKEDCSKGRYLHEFV